ncbi:CBN-SRR-7 protein [Caenorhabditis brenneri]|uniref:CBN-SRR-7 protein n=1 Tax=Caenorhabditis brenneri TaxID=135651 RepID=G0MS88_CAEBE|nr:CBN-SRR-7 protein [Caenorhabditis brenneri]
MSLETGEMVRSSLIALPETKDPLVEEPLLGGFRKIMQYTSIPTMPPPLLVFSSNDLMVSQLLGPFNYFVKLTLLDCSAKSRRVGFLSRLVAVLVITLLSTRVAFLMMKSRGNVLSFAWAESNFFGFPAIFTQFCGICIFSWTRKEFVETFCEKLGKLKLLRLEQNAALDHYTKIHIFAIGCSIPWLVATMSWSVYNMFEGKIFFGGEETNILFCGILVISNCYIWFISSICLAYYVLIFSAINRETKHFNEELESAKKEKTLKNIEVLEKFDYRQNEILNIVLFINESLSFFGGLVPLFLFYGLVNGVYLTAFMDSVPLLYFAILMFNLAAIIFYNLAILLPACALQEHLTATSRILINNNEFECSKNSVVYRTYRVMVDRIEKIDSTIHVVGAFPINRKVLAAAAFIVPNLGFLLVLVKKVILANGGVV